MRQKKKTVFAVVYSSVRLSRTSMQYIVHILSFDVMLRCQLSTCIRAIQVKIYLVRKKSATSSVHVGGVHCMYIFF